MDGGGLARGVAGDRCRCSCDRRFYRRSEQVPANFAFPFPAAGCQKKEKKKYGFLRRRLELRMLDSKSRVITTSLSEKHADERPIIIFKSKSCMVE